MQGVFISYRREDTSAYSRLLYNRLVKEFGSDVVFMDVETIREPGADFVDAINEGVGQCTVLLALIGKDWFVAGPDGVRRIDDPDDFVRIEVASALERDVRVIPVVVDGAKIPGAEDLPEELKLLARRQALKLSHEDWEYDIGKLIEALAKMPGFERRAADRPETPPPPPPQQSPQQAKKGWSTAAVAIVALVAVVAVFLFLEWNRGQQRTEVVERIIQQPAPVEQTIIQPVEQTAIQPVEQAAIQPVEEKPAPAAKPVTQKPKIRYSEDVRTVQESLTALDYEPGVIDGLLGGATVSAIREFQDDEGYPVTGRVDAMLLAQLHQALQEEAASAIAFSQPQQPAMPMIDISGNWYDNDGVQFRFEQTGNTVRISAFNLLAQQWVPLGSGTFDGNVLTIRYSGSGISGTVVASMAPDGRHLNGTDTPDVGMSVPTVLHFEHMPGY